LLLLEDLIVGEVLVSEAEDVGGATGECGLVEEEGGGEGDSEESRQQGGVREEGEAMVLEGALRGDEVLREGCEGGKGL
jgi:hypothetical protein